MLPIACCAAVVVVSVIAVWALNADGNPKTDPASMVTFGTAALTGLIGLFVPATKAPGQD